MVNWFSKVFIGSALFGSLSAQPAKSAEKAINDPKTDPIEYSQSTNKNASSQIRIYKKVNQIEMDSDLPRSWNGGGHNTEIKASYDHAHKRVVCQTYSIGDDVAYLRAKHISPDGCNNPPRKDFNIALKEFHHMLNKVKFNGKLPENLDDVRALLEAKDLGLNDKKTNFIKQYASEIGLQAAIALKKTIEKVNQANTDCSVILHELEHGATALVKEKATLPSSLLSPQDYMLFCMADEINSFCKGDALNGLTPDEVVKNFRLNYEETYIERFSKNIGNDNSYWNSETYRHSFAQNMEISRGQKITRRAPIVFSNGENISVVIDGQKFNALKCINETNNSWCYTVLEDGERKHLPQGTVLTASNGKKYEANVLYDGKTGKPLLDKSGHKNYGYGFWDEDKSSWSIKISEQQVQAKDNFSKNNFEKLLTEKFGEKTADNLLRNLIEGELDRYRQTDSYKFLSGICSENTIKPSYVKECKETPLTDDYIKKGANYRADLTNDMTNLVDITESYEKQYTSKEHLNRIRKAKSGQNLNVGSEKLDSNNQTQISTGKDYTDFLKTLNTLNKGR